MNLAMVRQQIDNLLLALPELAEDEILRPDMVEADRLMRRCSSA